MPQRPMAHSKPSNGAAIRSENLLGTRRLGNTQCPRSARAVPAQCPRQCPPGKQSSARGSLVPGKKAEASIPTQEQKKRGHCFVFQAGTVAGTVRALRGHCAGTVYSLGAALPAGGRQPPPWRPPVATPWPPTRSYLGRRPQCVMSKGHAAEETTPRM